jgi:MoaA/NifB/PqqE/SkfB family radical SAM enzyme
MGVLYTKTKIFHFKEKLDSLSRAINKIMPPLHVRIKLTNICNHSCRYCAYRADNLVIFGKDSGQNTKFIPREKVMEIIDDIIVMRVNAVTFSGGGEPFLYPYFLDVLKRLAKSPVRFASLTNGSRLEGKVAEIFSKHGTWVRVSMDGWDDASYSSYRNVPLGEFTKIMQNMKNFKRLRGKCYLGVSLIVDKKNATHIYTLLSKLKKIGVDSVKISPCLVSDNEEANNNYIRPILPVVK